MNTLHLIGFYVCILTCLQVGASQDSLASKTTRATTITLQQETSNFLQRQIDFLQRQNDSLEKSVRSKQDQIRHLVAIANQLRSANAMLQSSNYEYQCQVYWLRYHLEEKLRAEQWADAVFL